MACVQRERLRPERAGSDPRAVIAVDFAAIR